MKTHLTRLQPCMVVYIAAETHWKSTECEVGSSMVMSFGYIAKIIGTIYSCDK